MAAANPKYIIAATIAGITLGWTFDYLCSERKLFGGTTTTTVSTKWIEETEKKFAAWPRTAAPPVAINPIRRQNFLVKSRLESRIACLLLILAFIGSLCQWDIPCL